MKDYEKSKQAFELLTESGVDYILAAQTSDEIFATGSRAQEHPAEQLLLYVSLGVYSQLRKNGLTVEEIADIQAHATALAMTHLVEEESKHDGTK